MSFGVGEPSDSLNKKDSYEIDCSYLSHIIARNRRDLRSSSKSNSDRIR